MAETDGITRRINTAEDLRSIVRTMKALAAANIRQYEDAAASLVDYAAAVALGFQALFKIRPDRLPQQATKAAPQRIGAIVLGSDHGLCGAFNERVTDFYLERRWASAQGGPVIALGGRVADRLDDRGVLPDEVIAQPASAGRIGVLVRELLERVAGWRDAGTADAVRVYFNAARGRASYQPREELLLPLDEDSLRRQAAAPWRPRAWPTIAGDWDALFAAVVEQHLFVTLHRAIAQSLAGENASRLTAMHAAERNIDDRLHALRGQFHRERQTAITTELLDIVSGYEALTSGGPRKERARDARLRPERAPAARPR